MKISSRENIIDLINHCEENFAVTQWKVNDIDIWPAIRIQVFFDLLHHKESFEKNDNQSGLLSYNRFGSYLDKLKNTLHYLRFVLSNKSNSETHLYMGSNAHRVALNGNNINRFFDPLMDQAQSNTNSVLIEYNNKLKLSGLYKAHRIIDSGKLFSGFNIFHRNINIKGVSLPDHKAFYNYITKYTNPGFLSKNAIIELSKTINKYSDFYQFLFKKTNAKKVVVLCYYTKELYGAIHAAHKLGITSIDMQHGPQPDTHAAYGSWSNVPQKVYNILPKSFWCWDLASAKSVNKSFPGNPAYVGGNTWVEAWKNKTFRYDYQFNTTKKIVLLSLQPIDPIMEPWLIDLIHKTKDKYQWMIRLHPRMGERSKEALKEEFNGEDVEIDQATEMPLPYLLSHAALHITGFSGTVLEAAMFNVFSIFTDKRGLSAFNHLIEYNMAVFMEHFDEQFLTKVIKQK